MLFKHSLFVHYMRPYTGQLCLNALLRSLSAVFTTVLVFAVAPLLSLLFGTGGSEPAAEKVSPESPVNALMDYIGGWVSASIVSNGKGTTLIYVVLALFAAYFLKNLCAYLGLYFFIPIRTKMVAHIRSDLFHKFMVLPLSYYATSKKGDLLARMSHNSQDVDNQMLSQIQSVMVDIITMLFLIATLFFISVELSLFVLVMVPLIGVITSFLGRSLRKKSKVLQKTIGNISAQVTQTLDGIKTIRSYNASENALKKFKRETQLFFLRNRKVAQRIYLATPLNEVLGTAAVVAVLIAGGWMILHEKTLRPEVFIVYLVTMIQILPSSKNVISAYFTFKSGKVSLHRVKEVLNAKEIIEEKPNAVRVPDLKDAIEFEDVSFSHASTAVKAEHPQPTLQHINLRIERGKFVALVGPSGGGKTTLLNMIPRFYDPDSGHVRFDGTDLRESRIDDIRALSSLVSQDTVLFNDTIYNNILLGNLNATREEVIEAARMADAHEFIMATENGYESNVGESGTKLSGGQRQRLSIARALVKNAPILLFDEATSALDTEAEMRIMQAIMHRGKARNQTVVSIAHRLSSIRNADEIIVIDHGEIVGRGTHQELFNNNALYHKLCVMQDNTAQGKRADLFE